MARLGGKSRPSLILGAGIGVDRWADLTSYQIAQDGGATSFADLFEGQDEPAYVLSGSAIQTTESQSLWRYVWHASGDVVPFTVRPWGNEVATFEKPHYRGEVIIGPRPTLGGEASADVWIFDFSWRIVGDVEEVVE